MVERSVPRSLPRAIVEADPSTFNVTEFCRPHWVSTWLFHALRRRYAVEGSAALERRSWASQRGQIGWGKIRGTVSARRKRLDEQRALTSKGVL
jgi:hypothetical protein